MSSMILPESLGNVMDRVNQEVDSILRTLRSQPFQRLRDTEIVKRQHKYVDDINQQIEALETIVTRLASEEVVDDGTSAAKSTPVSTTTETTATSTTTSGNDSDRVRGNDVADDTHTIQTSTEEQYTRPRIRLVSRLASQEVDDGTSAAKSMPVSTTSEATATSTTTSGNDNRTREETKQVEPEPKTTQYMIPPNKICDPSKATEVEIEHTERMLKLKDVFHQRKSVGVSKTTLWDLFCISNAKQQQLVKAYYCKSATFYAISMYDRDGQRCVDLVLFFPGRAQATVYPLKVINQLMEKGYTDMRKVSAWFVERIQPGKLRYRVSVGSDKFYID
jgi:hypothetical protein